MTDIASQLSDLRRGFESLGIGTLSAVNENPLDIARSRVHYDFSKEQRHFFRGVRPRSLQRFLQNRFDIRRKVWKQALEECDTFVYVWSTYEHDCSDLAELKKRNKKIVFFFTGSDVRYWHAYVQELERYGLKPHPNYAAYRSQNDFDRLQYKIGLLRNAEKYADLIFSLPNQSQVALRPYFHFYLPLWLDDYPVQRQQRESVPVITHAPSNRKLKGTDAVFGALKRLEEEGVRYKLVLIENMPNEQAVKAIAESDILIGELYCPSGGRIDREALASGVVSLSSVRREYIDIVPEDCPIVDTREENLYEVLKDTILNFAGRSARAAKGRPYVGKYHDVKKICGQVLDMLETRQKKFDYYPAFFRNDYKPLTQDIPLINQWTGFVSECDWYRQYVVPGERSGLKF